MSAIDELIERIDAWTGIRLERSGSAESLARLVRGRVRELGLPSPEAYVAQLDGALRLERALLVSAVTVNFTWFFRDEEQMEGVFRLLRDGWPKGRSIDVWVPGCATGEDAYTLAMLARDAGREVRLLGSDLNPESVARANEGRYGPWSLRELPAGLRGYFAAEGKTSRVADEVRRGVRFEVHNLVDPPPRPAGGGGWHLVLCRNVLIYFARAKAEEAHERLGASLAPEGWLLVGASETLCREPPGLRLVRLGNRAALYRPASPEDTLAGFGLATPAEPYPAARLAEARPEPEPVPEPMPAPAAQGRPTHAGALALVAKGAGRMKTAPAEAIGCFERARELDPLCVEAHLHLGIAFHLAADPVAAVPALRAALFLDGLLWPAAFYLALSYESLGQPGEARREYRRVLETCDGSLELEVRGALSDMQSWKADVLALSRRRAGPPAPRRG